MNIAQFYSHSHIDGLVIATARVLTSLQTPGRQFGLWWNTPRGHRELGGGSEGGEGQGGVVLVSDHGPLQQTERGVTSDQGGQEPHHCHLIVLDIIFHVKLKFSILVTN